MKFKCGSGCVGVCGQLGKHGFIKKRETNGASQGARQFLLNQNVGAFDVPMTPRLQAG